MGYEQILLTVHDFLLAWSGIGLAGMTLDYRQRGQEMETLEDLLRFVVVGCSGGLYAGIYGGWVWLRDNDYLPDFDKEI